MSLSALRVALGEVPLIASVQAPSGTPCDDPVVIRAMALASLSQGVKVLRLQGIQSIQAVYRAADTPIIGLVKKVYLDSEVYITPTAREVREVAKAGASAVALDATPRHRPEGVALADLVKLAKSLDMAVMGDCDSVDSVRHAVKCGCDLVGTTLSGYTESSSFAPGPDLELVRAAVDLGVPVLAEGRYEEPWQVRAALAAGALGVVVGGALNDPIKTTTRFLAAARRPQRVGAVDLGGTWLRWGVFEFGKLAWQERIPLPQTHLERMDWISGQAMKHGIDRIGVSAGGVIDPRTARVTEAKAFVPDYVGRAFAIPQVEVFAANDGLATAWGHATHGPWYGKRVLTVALGTGVGCGVAGPRDVETNTTGDYPRLNDLATRSGNTFEDLLGGLNLGSTPSQSVLDKAFAAAEEAVCIARALFQPDVTVICGGVGLADWMTPLWEQLGVLTSPFGQDAGLMGAAMLAANPPERFVAGGVVCA